MKALHAEHLGKCVRKELSKRMRFPNLAQASGSGPAFRISKLLALSFVFTGFSERAGSRMGLALLRLEASAGSSTRLMIFSLRGEDKPLL